MLDLLHKIVVSGFAAIDKPNAPLAQILLKQNVAGVVKRSNALVVGLPCEVWDNDANFGLVPASQEARLMIADELARLVVWV